MSGPASGRQVRLVAGDAVADVVSVGAGVRALEVDGRPLVTSYDADRLRPFYRGATLVPWPNRVVDGRYAFGGEELQLPLTEPERGHALHGLGVWLDFDVVDRQPDRVRLEAVIVPQAGYPFRLHVAVEHRLDPLGLTTTVTAVNTGHAAAPYGSSIHPYLVGGPGRVDDWTLELDASSVLEVDDRLVPTGTARVAGGPFDFSTARRVGDLFVDHAFTGLAAQTDGRSHVRVRGADGRGAEMVSDPGVLPWVQVHTADRPEAEFDRTGLAVEPMTCPPDAFNSGTGLVVLEPGDEHAAEWMLRAL